MKSVHIHHEAYDLSQSGIIKQPTSQQMQFFWQIFPGTTKVHFRPPMVVITVKALPPKPWPITAAGAPIFVTTDPDSEGLTHYRFARAGPALQGIKPQDIPLKELVYQVANYLEQESKIKLVAVAFFYQYWVVTVLDGTSENDIPMKMAGLLVEIQYLSETDHGSEFARRQQEPTTERDSSDYTMSLRPGVMLSSMAVHGAQPRPEKLTTSGVAVRDKRTGQKYVTCASQGFELGEERVFHPQPPNQIGEVKYRLHESDISLAELKPDLRYSNEPFETQDGPRAMEIKDFADSFAMQQGDEVYMNNPFSGACQGVHISVSLVKVPDPAWGSTGHESSQRWITHHWSYLGNGRDLPEEGSCGTAVLTEQNQLCSFFRILNGTSGMALSVAADVLAENYEIASI